MVKGMNSLNVEGDHDDVDDDDDKEEDNDENSYEVIMIDLQGDDDLSIDLIMMMDDR